MKPQNKIPYLLSVKEAKAAKSRLEFIRQELRKERISYEELFELQTLTAYIDKNDVELLEAAGVKEK